MKVTEQLKWKARFYRLVSRTMRPLADELSKEGNYQHTKKLERDFKQFMKFHKVITASRWSPISDFYAEHFNDESLAQDLSANIVGRCKEALAILEAIKPPPKNSKKRGKKPWPKALAVEIVRAIEHSKGSANNYKWFVKFIRSGGDFSKWWDKHYGFALPFELPSLNETESRKTHAIGNFKDRRLKEILGKSFKKQKAKFLVEIVEQEIESPFSYYPYR